MEDYNFNQTISRHGSFSAKWHNEDREVIPLSVADMDFITPDFMINTITEFMNKKIFGYTELSSNWNKITSDWFKRHYDWIVEPEHIVFCPRIVQAISIYIQNYTQPGDKITTLSPSYQPITNAVKLNERELLLSDLFYSKNRYSIDFDDLENKFKESVCFILLSPHNPTGSVWSEEDLIKIATLAEKYQVFIISDDVHADFIFDGSKHQVISSISSYVKNNSFICTSPSKTFNIPGLEIANIVISNEKFRNKFRHCLAATGFHNPNYFAVPAFISAYVNGDQWLNQLKEYIKSNKEWFINFCKEFFPEWEITTTQGTYMCWVNYKKMNICEQELKYWFINLAKVEMSFGSNFGAGGEHFFRINLATPLFILQEALIRLKKTNPYKHVI